MNLRENAYDQHSFKAESRTELVDSYHKTNKKPAYNIYPFYPID